MITKIKNDFKSVYAALNTVTNRRVPKWVAVIWYVLLLPLGIIGYPFAKIWAYNQERKMNKFIDKIRNGGN